MKNQLGTLKDSGRSPNNRIMVGIPMTGMLRSEWVLARYGQVVPCNWSQSDCMIWLDQYSPLRYSVADARNLIASRAVEEGFKWLFFIDHDVVLPPLTLLRMNEYMLKKQYPIVSGLYFTRSAPAEPLLYRGRGNSYFSKWTLGDKVWADGTGLGCTLIHGSILKAAYDEAEEYLLQGKYRARRIFSTQAKCWWDPEACGWQSEVGTEDLDFYHRLQEHGLYAKAGWKKFQQKRFPLLIDTGIFCKHIDWNGVQYPANGEELAYLKPEDRKTLGA